MWLRKVFLYAALLTLTQCSKCKDDDPAPKKPDLPEATQTGARTFGCYVNGKPFTASGLSATGDLQGGTSIAIRAEDIRNHGSELQATNILLNGRLVEGEVFSLVPMDTRFSTNPTQNQFAASYTTYDCHYDGRQIKSGTVELTHWNAVNGVASGRFSFTLYNTTCDTVRITDGRFDVKF